MCVRVCVCVRVCTYVGACLYVRACLYDLSATCVFMCVYLCACMSAYNGCMYCSTYMHTVSNKLIMTLYIHTHVQHTKCVYISLV